MIKKIFFILLLSLTLITNSYAAGSGDSGGDGAATKSNYDKAVKLIKIAKKNEKKGKNDKAKSNYEKAFKLLVKSNKKKPNKPDTLNYLGFTSRKLGDFKSAENYYLSGLKINPNHNGINEYLGELYLSTNRPEKAKERLAVLQNCNCEEYEELKAIIDGTKQSKY